MHDTLHGVRSGTTPTYKLVCHEHLLRRMKCSPTTHNERVILTYVFTANFYEVQCQATDFVLPSLMAIGSSILSLGREMELSSEMELLVEKLEASDNVSN